MDKTIADKLTYVPNTDRKSLKVQEIVKQTNKEALLETLWTSAINIPMSSTFLDKKTKQLL